MRHRNAAILTLLLIAGVASSSRADIAPPNLCTAPGQPCMNACTTGSSCRDSGSAPGVCMETTCARTGPTYIEAGPDSEGGVVFDTIYYPCNLCLPSDGGDAAADANEDVEAGGAGGSGASGGAAGATATGGAGGVAGSAGTGGGSNDSGCSCVLDGDGSRASMPLAAIGLASIGGYFWLRRRATRTSKGGGHRRRGKQP